MADDRRPDGEEPSLELPSLFRRRDRRDRSEPQEGREPAAAPDEPTALVERVPEPTPEPEPAPRPVTAPARRARRSTRSVPALPVPVAAAAVGLVVGLVGTLLTWGGLQACEVVRGTESCGGPGLLLLVAIVVVMVLVGAVLLALLRVPDARSISALGTGIVCVVAMVGLLEVVFSAGMFVAVPVVGAVAYAVASWVATRFVEEVDEGPGVDVR